MTNGEYLKRIKPGCFMVYKKIKILPSVAAAQTILESAWGRSTLASQHHNHWGIKSFNPSERRVRMATMEYGPGGAYSTFAYFRSFRSMEEGFDKGYIDSVLGNSRYRAARGVTDPRRAITLIWQAGYATDANYPNLIMSVINANRLTDWDREALAGGDGGYDGTGSTELDGTQFYTLNNRFISKNPYTRPGIKLKGVAGVVLRDAGTPGLGLESILSNLNKGNSGNKKGFHILIDKKNTVAAVPLEEVTYHSDPTKNMLEFLQASSKDYAGGNMNLNTISIGICRESDGRFHNDTLARVIAVCSELVNHYALPSEMVLRGQDVDGSLDPIAFYQSYTDYSTILGLINYQRNQDTPLLNTDLAKLLEEQLYEEGKGGQSSSANEVINATSGARRKLLEKAFEIQTWGLTYSQPRRYQIHRNGYSDCSSYVEYVYRHAIGVEISTVTWTQWARGRLVARKDALPGDLVHWDGHVGMVTDKGGNWVIHSGVSGYRRGESIQHVRIDQLTASGMRYMGIRRYISEEGDTSNNTAGSGNVNYGGSTSNLDPGKQYYLHAKESFNSYNADNDNPTSIKKIPKGTVLKVLSLGAYAYRVGEGEWIRKKDSSKYELRGTAKKSEPIGTARVIGRVEPKTQPSLASASVLEQGRNKFYDVNTVLPVFGMRNGLYQISEPERQNAEYIPFASANYTSGLEDMTVYTDRNNDDDDMSWSVEQSVKVKAKLVKGEYDPTTGRITVAGTLAASPKSFPVGSRLSLTVPSKMVNNETYYVGSYHEEDDNVIYLYMDDPAEVVKFSERVGSAKVISMGT